MAEKEWSGWALPVEFARPPDAFRSLTPRFYGRLVCAPKNQRAYQRRGKNGPCIATSGGTWRRKVVHPGIGFSWNVANATGSWTPEGVQGEDFAD